MRKTLKELNLLDDFLFGILLTYPEVGEKFSRALLQTIFQREFGKLTVIPQKIYYGSDTDQHGARLDVYMEEEDAARVLLNKSKLWDFFRNPNLNKIQTFHRKAYQYPILCA